MADRRQPPPELDLDAVLDRLKVRAGSAVYELRSPDELSILEIRRILKWGLRNDELEKIEEPTQEQSEEYDRNVLAIARRVLDAPPEAVDGLTPRQRAKVGVAFIKLWLESANRTDQARATEETVPTGDPAGSESAPTGAS